MSAAPAPAGQLPADPPPPRRSALAVVFLIVVMDLMGFGVIIPLLPFYATQYQASAVGVGLLFSLYSLCQMLAAPILGALSDRYGRRPVLIVSQLGSAAGYVLLGVVTQYHPGTASIALGLIYLSRVIDGLSGGNISTAQAYISDVTTAENRAKGMGMIGAAFGIGFAAGPALGGLLGDRPERVAWPAFAAAGFCLVATALTSFLLPESRPRRASARDVALTSEVEQDVAAPLLDQPDGEKPRTLAYARPRLVDRVGIAGALRRPMLVQLMLIGFASMAAFVMMESQCALFLSRPDTFGWGPRNVGWFFTMIGVVIIVVQGVLIGRLTKRLGEWPLAVAGAVFVAIGMTCFVRTGYRPWLPLLLLGGCVNACGRSLQGPTISSLVSKFSDAREQGAVFGLFHGLSSFARVIGPVTAGFVYERHPTGPFVLAGVIMLSVALWTAALRATAPRPDRVSNPPAPAGSEATPA